MLKKLFVFATIFLTLSTAAFAQAGALQQLRDTEIETFLKKISTPIFSAAGLDPHHVKLYLINSQTPNAFVAAGQNLFINSGLIYNTENEQQLSAVIAHETGHIMGAHIVALSGKMASSKGAMVISTIAAVLVGGFYNPAAGFGILAGMESSITGDIMSYSRTEELTADQIATNILNKIDISPTYLADFLKLLGKKSTFTMATLQSPYRSSHPAVGERIEKIESNYARPEKYEPTELHDDYLMVKAKLFAYLNKPELTLQRHGGKTDADKYAQSFAYFKQHEYDKATTIIDELIKKHPKNPYFHELAGQFNFEQGKYSEAKKHYAQAYSILPDDLIGLSYSQVLLELDDDPDNLKLVTTLLQKVLSNAKNIPAAYKLMATACGRAGELGKASYYLAEHYRLLGQKKSALTQAKKAEDLLSPDDNEYILLQDLKRTFNK